MNQEISSAKQAFNIKGRVALITGGAGLLGIKHAEAIAEAGGIPILLDIDGESSKESAKIITETFNMECHGLCVDITNPDSISEALETVLSKFGRVDILINNAANNPKVEGSILTKSHWSRLENFPLDVWNKDVEVGLTGAFLCSKIVGCELARRGKGVILNISSDLGIIAPDQRIYKKEGLPDDMQPVKPITYSVIKHGLIGLTKYLATYWADKGVRVNALCPGGVYNNQPDEFVKKLTNLIPMGRMADVREYKAAILFLISDASSYMTGSTLTIDGGRTCW